MRSNSYFSGEIVVFTEEQVKHLTGLSESQAQEKLRITGYNELPSAKKRSIFRIALEVTREPMFLLLVACGIIYIFIGEVNDAIHVP